MASVRVEQRDGAPLRCAWCHDPLGVESRLCDECGTWLHPECSDELRRCPTLGCPGSSELERSPPARTGRGASRAASLVAVVAVALVAAVVASVRPPRPADVTVLPPPALPAPQPTANPPQAVRKAPEPDTSILERPLIEGSTLRLGATADELARALGLRSHAAQCGRWCALCLAKGVDPTFDARGRLVSIRFYWNGSGVPNVPASRFPGRIFGALGEETTPERARALLGAPMGYPPYENTWTTIDLVLALGFDARATTLRWAEVRTRSR